MASQAYATQALQRSALRRRCGQGSSVEIFDNDEVDDALSAALNELNRMDPKYYFGSFSVAANVQRYLISSFAPSTKVGPLEVFWGAAGDASSCSTPGIFTSIGDAYSWIFRNLFGEMNQAYIDEMALEISARNYAVLERYLGGRGWEEKDGYVWLEPRPTSASSCYYMCPIARFSTPLETDTEYIEALLDYATYIGCTMLAAKQSEVKEVQRTGGRSVYTQGGIVYMDIAEKALKKWNNRMIIPPTIIYSG